MGSQKIPTIFKTFLCVVKLEFFGTQSNHCFVLLLMSILSNDPLTQWLNSFYLATPSFPSQNSVGRRILLHIIAKNVLQSGF